MYRAIFSRRAEKAFLALPARDAQRIKEVIGDLTIDPRGYQTIKLDHAPVAQYRRRVGNYRILFDINDASQTLEVLDIRNRDEQTYR
ncbi:MAG TPA: type II toxin-antitoxin system RelE/ParE family toxin [Chloroflexota bacterium]|nr:type II toxin-antitoxin system RelE/ParE family toxin [Chloroflexota bacterium]